MRQNIQRTEQRGENIDNMVDKTNGLEERAKQFRRGANRVRKYEMWKNVRMWVWIILGLAVIALIIGLGMLRRPPGLNTKRNVLTPFYSRAFWQIKIHQDREPWPFRSLGSTILCMDFPFNG